MATGRERAATDDSGDEHDLSSADVASSAGYEGTYEQVVAAAARGDDGSEVEEESSDGGRAAEQRGGRKAKRSNSFGFLQRSRGKGRKAKADGPTDDETTDVATDVDERSEGHLTDSSSAAGGGSRTKRSNSFKRIWGGRARTGEPGDNIEYA